AEPCLHVLVEKKVPFNELYKRDLIPNKFLGVKTDVLETGFVNPIMYTSKEERKFMRTHFKTRKRPVQGGYSIGFSNWSGTLGAIVFDNKNNTPYILSNNHVLAYEGKERTPIFQPSLSDGGAFSDKIAVLYKVIKSEINLKGKKKYKENEVDCAIAQINPYINYSREIYGIGEIKGISEPKLGAEIRKVGRSTGYTTGTIKTINASFPISIDENSYKLYKNQIITTKIGNAGDSGSIVVDLNTNVVGLMFSGSKTANYCNPISKVMKLLNIHF
ncbi:MAG: hypothetical protein ACRC7R_01180, partial [Sarcina sp.]